MSNKTICWFSCGAASAVAAKLTLEVNPNALVVYQHTGIGSEHPDNMRFLKDCEKWFGKEIIIHGSDNYDNHWDVIEKTQYLVGPQGARCTTELKRKVARKVLSIDDVEVFGYTVEERKRCNVFQERHPERKINPILIERGLTKADCLGMLAMANIDVPVMYKLGYKNNNCIGCVKGGAGYWNKIRLDFPDVFDRMAKLERTLNRTILRKQLGSGKNKSPIFLDELEPNAGNYSAEEHIECGLMCQIETHKLQMNLVN